MRVEGQDEVQVSARLSRADHKALLELAAWENRSLSQQLRSLIQQASREHRAHRRADEQAAA